jgi:hypothetical protein
MRGALSHARCCGNAWRLRGRRPVRADRRLRADDESVRAQSTILDKTTPCWVLTRTVFFERMRFSSVQKARLARAARKVFRGI